MKAPQRRALGRTLYFGGRLSTRIHRIGRTCLAGRVDQRMNRSLSQLSPSSTPLTRELRARLWKIP